MRKILLFLLVLLSCKMTFAQNPSFQNYFQEGLYQFQDTLKIQKSQIFTNYLSYFGFTEGNGMSLQSEGIMDTLGGESDRYIQYCNGYPVEGSMVNVISKYGIVLYVNGLFLPNLNTNVSSPISQSAALTTALQLINAPKYAWQDSTMETNIKRIITQVGCDTCGVSDTTIDSTRTYYPKSTLVIARPYGDTSVGDTSKYALCWKLNITPMYLDTFVVDTNTIDTVSHYDTLRQYRAHNEMIVYINATNGNVYGLDSNIYAATGHINPTYYEGNRNVDIKYNGWAWWLFGEHKYEFQDGRGIYLEHSSTYGTLESEYDNHTDTWGAETGKDAYWQLETASDYFKYNHGFSGTTEPPNAYQYASEIWRNQRLSSLAGSEWRTYYYFSTATYDDTYFLGSDITDGSLPKSAAFLDVMGHEYTHAMIYHGPHFDRFAEAGAIAEGFCDWFGDYVATTYDADYYSDWWNGFGWQTRQFARNWTNPTADFPAPSSARYGDSYFTYGGSADIYKNSGVMRRFLYTLYGMEPYYEHHDFVTMYWWCWSSLDYNALRNQYLAEASYFFGTCSPTYQHVNTAWLDVNVGSVLHCRAAYIKGQRVSHSSDVGNHTVNITIASTTDDGTYPDSKQPISYNWNLPSSWNVIYNGDHSQITLDAISDYSSQMVSCIVNYSDSTHDTLSIAQHFVDGEGARTVYQQSSVQSKSVTDLQLFPNPAKKQLNVVLPFQPKSNVAFSLVDVTGRVLYSTSLSSANSVLALPDLNAGIYMVKINGDGKEYTRRITIE